jgi:MFS family permease
MQEDAVAESRADRSGEPVLIAFLLLSVGALSIAFSVIAPLLGPIAAQFGGAAVAQQIVVAPLAGFAIGGLIAGSIVGIFGARTTLLASAVIYIVTGASGLYAQSAEVLLANAFILGAAAVILVTAAGVVLADRFHGDLRARIIGLQTASGSLLNAVAVFMSGVIAEAAGWRMSFLLFVGLGLVLLVLAAVAVRSVPRPPKEAGGGGAAAYLPLMPIFVASALYLVVNTNTVTHMSLLLAAEHVTSTTVAATIMAIQGLASMVGGFLYGPFATRIGRLTTLGLGVALCAGGLVLTGALPSVPAFAIGVIAMGVSVGFVMPFLIERLLGVAPERIRAQALGFFATAQFAGGYLNPFVVGPVREALGLHGMYIACGAATAVIGFAAVAVLAGRRAPAPSPSLH